MDAANTHDLRECLCIVLDALQQQDARIGRLEEELEEHASSSSAERGATTIKAVRGAPPAMPVGGADGGAARAAVVAALTEVLSRAMDAISVRAFF